MVKSLSVSIDATNREKRTLPKRIPEDALTAIEDAVRLRPEGADLPEIANALKPAAPKRTLQYRLKHLVNAGRLVKVGDDRWAKYRLPAAEEAKALACRKACGCSRGSREDGRGGCAPVSGQQGNAHLPEPERQRARAGWLQS